MKRLLIIDDEESVCYSFEEAFRDDDVDVVSAHTTKEGLDRVRDSDPSVIVLDYQLPDGTGLELLQHLKSENVKQPVIFVTAYGSADLALQAMSKGAFDYLQKPLELGKLTEVIERAFEASRLMVSPAHFEVEDDSDRIVGRSQAMQETCKLIGRYAAQNVNVLILGESGVGKELVARALYQHSKRADQTFLALNCAAIPDALLESELFGHEAGAFTGAARRKIGKFEQCHRGTLFLDEIGEMSPSLQAKMLRVLQDQSFQRLGGDETIRVDVRVLAATNVDLEKAVEKDRFRKDLLFRLKGLSIRIPALRERKEDIAELIHYFLFRFNAEYNTSIRAVAPETIALLESYSWPGNVRELMGVVRSSMLNSVGAVLYPESLPPELRETPPLAPMASSAGISSSLEPLVARLLKDGIDRIYERALSELDRVLLTRVLEKTEGNVSKAAQILGLSRNTLRSKMRTIGLQFERVLLEEESPETPSGGSADNHGAVKS
jgi:two-component system, NtrC family, nitrogen regulation response regulator GlnG